MNVALLGVNLSRNDVKENASPDWGDGVVETLEDVELACSTAVNILNDLLSYEKMESGILELHKEPIVVLPFITDCVRIFSLQAREKGVTLKVDLTMTDEDIENGLYPVIPSDVVMGDRFKLEQVLRNLVSNALKFSPAGSTVTLGALYRPPQAAAAAVISESSPKASQKQSSRLTKALQSLGSFSSGRNAGSVKTASDNSADTDMKVPSVSRKVMHLMAFGNLIIRCVDQGAGISPENQAKLFRGVVQFNPEKLQAGGGSGFGMFISKGIVELHKGVMSVYSKGEGFGSTFSMEIPMQRTAPTSFGQSVINEDDRTSTLDDRTQHRDSAAIELTELNEGDEDADANDLDVKGAVDASEESGLIGIAPTDESKDSEEGLHVANDGSISIGRGSTEETQAVSTTASDATDAAVATAAVVATAAATTAAVASGTSNANTRTFTGPRYNMLIVDDSGMNRKMMVKSMTAKGHTCEEAEDGVFALEKMKATLTQGTSYDVILMDFIMPNMDGPSATKAIRELGITTPIFGLTGNCMQRDIDWFMSCGANHVLAKPINMKEFDRKMEEFKG